MTALVLCRSTNAHVRPPGENRCDRYRDDEADAELVDDVFGGTGIARERSEDRLDKEVVAAVENRGRPETPGSKRQPGQDEAIGYDHEREATKAVPNRCASVVVGKDQDRVMIGGPHQSANEANTGEANDLGQLRDKKAAPAYFFAERARGLAYHAERRSQEDEERKR